MRGSKMRRREFIAGLGVALWPVAGRTQQPAMPVVGLLGGVSFDGPYAAAAAAIREALRDAGFVEGSTLAIEQRAAGGRYERLPELAADLARSRAAAIVTVGAPAPDKDVRAAAAGVPIVFATGSDAVEVGVADGLDRPAADATRMSAQAASERVELLLEVRPGARLVGFLDNSRLSGAFDANVDHVTAAADAKGRELAVFDAGTDEEVETAFTQMALRRVRLLVVSADPFLTSRQEQIIALAAQSTMAVVYTARGAAVLGGLMSYGVAANDMYRVAGIYAAQILKGTTPPESRVALPARFELVVNARTAKALRIAVPRRLLARADEIIE
jgi:putative ABC transport system substrate-binding protein